MKRLSEIKTANKAFQLNTGNPSENGNNNAKRLEKHYDYDKADVDDIHDNYGNESYGLNSSLWKGANHPSAPIIDDIMNRYKTPKKMVVYSGSANDPRKHMDKEGIVNHPAYLSTSLSHHIAKGFTHSNYDEAGHTHRHLYRISVPKDHPSIFTNAMAEQELILPRNTKLRHLRTDTKTTDSAFGNTKYHEHLHNMEVVK